MTTTTDGRSIDLTRDEQGRRYRASVDGRVIGEAEFLLTHDLVVFTQTEVDPDFEGQGVGTTLVRWALDDARRRGYGVVASCPFVRSQLALHAEEDVDLKHGPRT
ncbi:MAG TPA: GNAT family N-acetyltransferase [Kineosporiaceae bacterium]